MLIAASDLLRRPFPSSPALIYFPYVLFSGLVFLGWVFLFAGFLFLGFFSFVPCWLVPGLWLLFLLVTFGCVCFPCLAPFFSFRLPGSFCLPSRSCFPLPLSPSPVRRLPRGLRLRLVQWLSSSSVSIFHYTFLLVAPAVCFGVSSFFPSGSRFTFASLCLLPFCPSPHLLVGPFALLAILRSVNSPLFFVWSPQFSFFFLAFSAPLPSFRVSLFLLVWRLFSFFIQHASVCVFNALFLFPASIPLSALFLFSFRSCCCLFVFCRPFWRIRGSLLPDSSLVSLPCGAPGCGPLLCALASFSVFRSVSACCALFGGCPAALVLRCFLLSRQVLPFDFLPGILPFPSFSRFAVFRRRSAGGVARPVFRGGGCAVLAFVLSLSGWFRSYLEALCFCLRSVCFLLPSRPSPLVLRSPVGAVFRLPRSFLPSPCRPRSGSVVFSGASSLVRSPPRPLAVRARFLFFVFFFFSYCSPLFTPALLSNLTSSLSSHSPSLLLLPCCGVSPRLFLASRSALCCSVFAVP